MFSGVGGDKLTADGGWSSASAGIASYTWEQVDSNGVIVWSSTTDEFVPLALPEVTEDTDFTVQLTITDTNGATDTTTADIGYVYVEPNLAPVPVIAAPDEMNMSGSFTADGSGSSDADGTIVTYLWEQIDNSGATVIIDSPNTESTSVVLPEVTEDTTITLQLTVTDDFGASEVTTKDVVIKFVDNEIPVAVIAGDAEASMGATITLDGTDSSDSDGTITGYAWTQCDSSGVALTIDNADTDTASITLPDVTEDTAVSVCLVVTDDQGSTSVQAQHDFVIKAVACTDTELLLDKSKSALSNTDLNTWEQPANTTDGYVAGGLAKDWDMSHGGTTYYIHPDKFDGTTSSGIGSIDVEMPSDDGGALIVRTSGTLGDAADVSLNKGSVMGQSLTTALEKDKTYKARFSVGGLETTGEVKFVIYGSGTAGDEWAFNATKDYIPMAHAHVVKLAETSVTREGKEWVSVDLEFTPTVDIKVLMFGFEDDFVSVDGYYGGGQDIGFDNGLVALKSEWVCP